MAFRLALKKILNVFIFFNKSTGQDISINNDSKNGNKNSGKIPSIINN